MTSTPPGPPISQRTMILLTAAALIGILAGGLSQMVIKDAAAATAAGAIAFALSFGGLHRLVE